MEDPDPLRATGRIPILPSTVGDKDQLSREKASGAQNKPGSSTNFCSEKRSRAYFQGIFYFVQPSTFIQIQLCHILVAAQWWRAGFHLTGAYFFGRAYIMSILKNRTRAYFQVRSYSRENRVCTLYFIVW